MLLSISFSLTPKHFTIQIMAVNAAMQAHGRNPRSIALFESSSHSLSAKHRTGTTHYRTGNRWMELNFTHIRNCRLKVAASGSQCLQSHFKRQQSGKPFQLIRASITELSNLHSRLTFPIINFIFYHFVPFNLDFGSLEEIKNHCSVRTGLGIPHEAKSKFVSAKGERNRSFRTNSDFAPVSSGNGTPNTYQDRVTGTHCSLIYEQKSKEQKSRPWLPC